MSLPWEDNYAPPATDDALLASVGGASIYTPTSVAQPAAPAPAVLTPPDPRQVQTPVGGTTQWSGAVEELKDATIAQVQAAVQARVAEEARKALESLTNDLGPAPVATLPDKGDLTKLDAWERALRTFGQGLAVTIIGALLTVLVTAMSSGTNFFTKDGWMAVATLAVGAVGTAICSYILRYIKEPAGAAINSSKKT